MEKMNERVAVVTGAGSGIGKALAMAFANEGAKVVLADVEDEAGEILEPRLGKGCQIFVLNAICTLQDEKFGKY